MTTNRDQPSLFDDIPRARNTDPETSFIAAQRLATAATHCRLMLAAFHAHPHGASDEQAAYTAGIHEEGVCWWHRASDLRTKGLIAWRYDPDGRQIKRPGSNGRPVGISAITPAGRSELGGFHN